MLFCIPGGNAQQAVGYAGLKIKKEVCTRCIYYRSESQQCKLNRDETTHMDTRSKKISLTREAEMALQGSRKTRR